VFGKLKWIADYVGQLSIETSEPIVLWNTGDTFDRPRESLRTTLRFAQWVKSLPESVYYFTTIGQHDIVGYSLPTYGECSIGILDYLPRVYGVDYPYENDIMGLGAERRSFPYASLHIGVGHLLTTSNPKEIRGSRVVGTHLDIHPNAYGCVAPKDIHWEDARLVLCAHIHQGFSACEHNGTWFSAPGALVRLNADELVRQPQISVIRLTSDLDVENIEYVPVPSRPAEEVFDLAAIENSATAEAKRTEFRDTITAIEAQRVSGQGVVEDWREALERMRSEVGDEVVSKLMEYCERT